MSSKIAIFRDMINYENGKNVQPKVVPNNQYFAVLNKKAEN